MFSAPGKRVGVGGSLLFSQWETLRDRTALADVKLNFLLFDIISLFFPLEGINKTMSISKKEVII